MNLKKFKQAENKENVGLLKKCKQTKVFKLKDLNIPENNNQELYRDCNNKNNLKQTREEYLKENAIKLKVPLSNKNEGLSDVKQVDFSMIKLQIENAKKKGVKAPNFLNFKGFLLFCWGPYD